MDAETINKARKELASQKKHENLVVLRLDYDTKLVLPHKDASALFAALGQAELIKDDYQKGPVIQPLERDKVQITLMSAEEYQQIKLANLLKIPLKELQTAMHPDT